MKAKRVRTRQDLADFIELAPQLAAQRGDSEHYVPLFTSDIKEWFAHRGWFSEPVELWLILDTAGRAVARTICHRSPELAQKVAVSDPEPSAAGHAPTTLFFGAIEAADEAALDHLIASLTTRARELAAERLFGPVSPCPMSPAVCCCPAPSIQASSTPPGTPLSSRLRSTARDSPTGAEPTPGRSRSARSLPRGPPPSPSPNGLSTAYAGAGSPAPV
ncbi:MAG: hypothetical protein ACTH96_12225 [Brevibacterium aurantiacum]